MYLRRLFLLTILLCVGSLRLHAQCGTSDFMEPGFTFLSSANGCAPFTVQIQTLFKEAVPGTVYFVDWGDGTAEDIYIQTNATGVIVEHTYPNSPTDCGYDVVIDSENGCNPRGSVGTVDTKVVVWTNDVIAIDPGVFRVCQGYATDLGFADNSDWNCFPHATRENGEPRWIQWIYGTGDGTNRIPGITVDGLSPGAYPYLNPAPNMNPQYPIYAPGEVSLPISVPVTTPADLGKEFEITLKNWNQCNAYDNNLSDGAFNPVSGDLINGDNGPQITTARIVIVDSPEPEYQTRLGDALGAIQTLFCVDEDVYFENLTPAIAGASFAYTWEFYDNSTGRGTPIHTSTSTNPLYAYATGGTKLIRLTVVDENAAGNCEAVYENTIFISPTLIADIGITDLAGNSISGDFCQEGTPINFDVRFTDTSTGVANASTRWRWEFYDENGNLFREEPSSGAYSSTELGPFDEVFANPGIYRVKLIIRDDGTSCESTDEVQIRVYESPEALFTADRVCEGNATTFENASTLNPIDGESIVSWEWDFDYDGVTFSKDATYDNQTSFFRTYASAGVYEVALRVTTDQNSCTDLYTQTVTVDPTPISDITADVTSGCSALAVTFNNNGVGSQLDGIASYTWEIDGGTGFMVDSVQSPTDPSFSDTYLKTFTNQTTTDKIYSVRLRTLSVNGCESVSDPIDITVSPGPRSGFVSLNYSPFDNNCSPIDVSFGVDGETQSLNPTEYVWSISDNAGLVYQENTGTTPAFAYTFSNNTQNIKDYSVTLNAVLPSGCSGDSMRTIRVNPVPQANFTWDTLALDCDLMTLEFEAAAKGMIGYEWEIRENGAVTFGSSSIGDNFGHTFNKSTTPINVEVDLKVTNFANCSSEIVTQSFVVPTREDITASFTATPTNQTLPSSTVYITNNSSSGPWQYEWDFGDGQTSNDPNVTSHTYSTYGNYLITLTISDGSCEEQHVEAVAIAPIPPVVDFEYDPSSGCAPLTVNFTNLTQYAEAGTYFWEFGEGQGTSRAIDPTYTYYESGVYTVSLSATNSLGDTITETKSLIIEVYERPTAQFEVRPATVYIPDNPVYVRNNSYAASEYYWDFGDGTTYSAFEPVHYYEEEGEYDIELIAINEYGCADTLTREGVVKALSDGQVLIPNAFSPNLVGPVGGENGGVPGTNDIFLPLTEGVTDFEMLIFNRWGELLFRSTNKAIGWNGYHNGKLCAQDVYVYKLTLTFDNGRKTTKIGDVNLIR